MTATKGRRVLFTGPSQATWEEFPLPSELKSSEVLVRTEASAVSAGTEIAVYTGTHIAFSDPAATWPRFPLSPGYAMAGRVEAVGRDVADLRPGDRVAGYGKHATHYVCDLGTTPLFPISDDVSSEQAALARLADIPVHAIRRAQVQMGETVVVFGQGLIGQFATQLARIAGARVVLAVDTLDRRLEVAGALGATRVLNPQRDDLTAATAEMTGGRGFNVAVEATGNPGVIPTALRSVGDLGRVVLLGAPRGKVEIDPYTDIFRKGIVLIGSREHTAPLVETPHSPWTRANNFRLCLDLVAQGRLRTNGLVTHRVPADEALAVFDALATRPADHLGVVIHWSGPAGSR